MNPSSQENERTTSGRAEGSSIVVLAQQHLESHPHFHHRSQLIRVEWVDQHLVLSGCVPSFHLKQLAQEAVRVLNVPIVNQIEVVCADGLSSTPRPKPSGQSFPNMPR